MLFHNPSRNEARDVPVNFSRSCFLFLSSISCNPDLAFLFFDPADAEAAGFLAWAGCVMVLVGGDCGRGTDRVFFSISICVMGDLRFGFGRLRFRRFWKAAAPLFTKGERLTKPQDLQVFCKITAEGRGLLSRTSLVSADPSSWNLPHPGQWVSARPSMGCPASWTPSSPPERGQHRNRLM